MSDGKVFVVMTASGRAREVNAARTIRDVLEKVYDEFVHAGRDWDRPARLFVDGACVVEGGLADMVAEYGRFCEARHDEAFAACEAWVNERFGDRGRADG